uniref:RRM domain-containing protein n=1 Tax=Parascaris univalens TaxID=6257 RepID=A0A915A9D1_PARUN
MKRYSKKIRSNEEAADISDEYIPGALTAFLNDNVDNAFECKKAKKRKKSASNEGNISNAVSLLFEKNASTTKIPEMPIGSAVFESKKMKMKLKNGEERVTQRKPSSRETQRLNRLKKERMTAEEKERTIFIGNAPTSATRKSIKKLFSKYGAIESVRLRSVWSGNTKLSKRIAVLKNDLSPKMHSLHFYVKFVNADSVKAALDMNGEKLDDHKLRVDSCTSKRNYDSQKTVFIGNVPFGTHDDDLCTHFEKCGDIDFVRIVRDRATGVGKGIAFVAFKETAVIPIALKMDGSDFGGRQLRVSRVQKKNKRLVGKEARLKKMSKKSTISEKRLSKFITNNRKVTKEKAATSGDMKKWVRKKIKKRQLKSASKSVMS